MGRIGFGELVLILAIVLLIVGARKLPEVGRALGEAVREFQRAVKGKGHGKGSST
jgi:sec-independent protein translocase protein TatA